MKKYLVGTCGNYDLESHKGDGQVIRTNIVTRALKEHYGDDSVCVLSYQNWKKNPLKLLISYIKLIKDSKVVVIFPDIRAYMFLILIGLFFGKVYHTTIFYNVIGGWLAKYLGNSPRNIKYVKKLKKLFVQTPTIKSDLKKLGVDNVVLFPNFRYRELTPEDISSLHDSKPLKLVYMARITKDKGTDGLIKVINKINADEVKFTLDIYGQVAENFKEEFSELLQKSSYGIKYCGSVEEENVGKVMKDYFLQVFPTRLYSTEGYPGSVLDAFYAGVPTLAARWNSFGDVIKEDVNGLGFEMDNFEELEAKLISIYHNPSIVTSLKKACMEEGKKFKPAEIIKIMTDEIDKVLW